MAGEKILIIDSDAERLETVVEQVLTAHGYKPLLAYSQNEGVKLVATKSPDLMLLHLPLDSTVQLLQRVAQTGRSIPVILMVDHTSILVPVELLRLGVQDYIAEPHTPDDILQAMHRVLERKSRSLNFEQLTEDLAQFNLDLEQRVKKFGAIRGNGGSAGLLENIDSVLNRVTETAVSVTGAETGYLFVLDDTTDNLRLRASQNLSKVQNEAFATQLEDSIARSIVRSGKPILLSGNNGQYFELKTQYPLQSLLNVPLKVDDHVIGILGVDNQTSNSRFSLVDLRRLTELADMAAAAVVNARQYTEARQEIARHLEEVATLQAVASQLGDITDFNMGAQLALSLAVSSTNAEAGVLAWLPRQGSSPIYVLQGNLHGQTTVEQNGTQPDWWDEQILYETIKSGQPVLSYDLAHRDNGKRTNQSRTYTRSRLIVPMRRAGKVMGAISLESSQPNSFTEDDLQFVTSIADQIVMALAGTILQQNAESEHERLSGIMEVVDNGVWLVDADLRLIAQNEAATEMLGWVETEVAGKSVCEFEAPNDTSGEGLCQLLSQTFEKRQLVSKKEGVLLSKKSGPPLLVSVRLVPVVHEGVILGAVCAFQLAKKSDEHVRFEFANMASHLLRTPLTSIQTSVDVLLSSELDAEEQRTMLDRLREQSQRMREFVKELLEMSRLEAGIVRVYSEPVALSPVLDRVLGLVRYEEPKHEFSLSVDGSLPIVSADLSKTELVLVNLLRNAVGRCPDGGQVGVEVETKEEEVIISVRDNGEAIPMAQLDRIFSQFYPIDSTNGTMMSSYHLGLYSTKRLIELQNGRVWVESQSGKGSRFSFSLPIWR